MAAADADPAGTLFANVLGRVLRLHTHIFFTGQATELLLELANFFDLIAVAHDAMRLEQIAQSLAEIEDRYNFAETSRPGWGARVPSIEMAFNALLDIHRQRLRPPPAASARPRSEKA